MQQYVQKQIAIVPKNLNIPLIYGSSCIIDVFRAMNIPLDTYRQSQSHPCRAEIKELERFFEKITHMPYEQRERADPYKQQYYMYGIDKALLNVLSIAEHIRSPYVIPSNANINQEMILALKDSQ